MTNRIETQMPKALVAIGEYLDQVRRNKHITRACLAAGVGISEKTLQRIALGDVDMKLSQFLRIMNYLGVDISELNQAIQAELLSSEVMEHRLLAAGADHNVTKLVKYGKDLRAAFDRLPLPWLRQSAKMCDLMVAELTQDEAAAQQAAKDLYAEYADFAALTASDFRMIARLAGYLPYADLRRFVTQPKGSTEFIGWTNTATQGEVILDTFFISLLGSALATRSKQTVRDAVGLIKDRRVLSSNYYFRLYKRFATAIEMALAGDVAGGVALRDHLLAAAAVFVPERILKNDRANIMEMWRELGAVTLV